MELRKARFTHEHRQNAYNKALANHDELMKRNSLTGEVYRRGFEGKPAPSKNETTYCYWRAGYDNRLIKQQEEKANA